MSTTRIRKLGIVAIGLLGAVLILGLALRPNHTAGPCTLVSGPDLLPEIPEASGLAVSRRTAGVIWSHNDSGHDSVLFALSPTGNPLGRVSVPIPMRDWEDISEGGCDAGACLYLGDIGDNGFARRRILIYRVPEPAPTDTQTAPAEVFTATYPDRSHNAEAMFVIGSDLFIITRDRSGLVYRATLPEHGGEIRLDRVGSLNLTAVTDAEASPDEKSVVVRTSHEAVFYQSKDLIRGEIIPYLRIPIDGLKESQGEGVAVDTNGMLYLASEGRPWRPSGRLLSLRCSF
jgi:hypothetical protein